MTTKIQEFHDYLLEDNETLIPPIFMDGYEETEKEFNYKSALKRIPVQVKAMAFGLAFATIGFITTWIGISK